MRDFPSADPAAVRTLAARLRSDAERLHDQAQRLDHRLDALNFEGPAALRLRAAMTERKLRALAVAGELRELSELADQSSHGC
jgi:succinylarginine dihydrolase